MADKKIIGYRVAASAPRSYVQVFWADEDRQVIDHAWCDTIKGPLLTRAEAYRVAAHWLECGYNARLVRVVRTKRCTFCPPCQCICYAR